ncbi:MAG: DUF3772 domain-containing protein [Alphaproteobacteria bacterium]|nr:DUF3772 domain-containing protein [Alphaproteobacteria bacterium]
MSSLLKVTTSVLRRLPRAAIPAVFVVAAVSVSAVAQTATGETVTSASPVSGWSAQLDTIAARLGEPKLSDDSLRELRNALEVVRRQARAWVAEEAPKVKDVLTEIAALGPPPAEGQEAEAEGIAAKRRALKGQSAELEGPVKEAEVLIGRASRLIGDVAEIRRKRFADRILARGASPLSPSVWSRALPEISSISGEIRREVVSFLRSQRFWANLWSAAPSIIVAIVVAIALVWPARRWLLRRFGRDPSVARPTFMEAARATLVVAAAQALFPTGAAALIYLVILGEQLLSEPGEDVAQAILVGFILFTWTLAFFRASLSPRQPAWRIIPVPNRFARGIRPIIIGLALVFAADIVLAEIVAVYGGRLAVTIIRDYLITVIVAALLLVLLLRQRMWMPEDPPDATPRWRVIRVLLATGLATLPIVGGLGYVVLARFVATQTVLTGGLILLVLFLRRLGREFINQAVSTETWLGTWLRANLHIDDEGARHIQFWVGLAYDLVLLMCGLVIGLFVWGADRKDVSEWVYQALFGFQIGQIRVSLVDLAVATLVFVGLIVLTRFIRRLLVERVLPQTRLDPGVRHSIGTATGYVGILIAAAAGISALGLDLSNLAILAGALSVGIGFGLQNVVNNFVSGLILLVERPIKVGDWVVVGSDQGYVKRIKVRATEIQTFDRASVFIPNSKIISESVINWTYADKMGRVIIPVGVAYGSNTGEVREVLLEIGKSHREVLKNPAPAAVFRGFGDSALNFELRCYLDNVERTVAVTSDLCFAIDDAFRRHGIAIPFPQQDVYVKQLPGSRARERAEPEEDAPTTQNIEVEA